MRWVPPRAGNQYFMVVRWVYGDIFKVDSAAGASAQSSFRRHYSFFDTISFQTFHS